jgi:hypothetical protein
MKPFSALVSRHEERGFMSLRFSALLVAALGMAAGLSLAAPAGPPGPGIP